MVTGEGPDVLPASKQSVGYQAVVRAACGQDEDLAGMLGQGYSKDCWKSPSQVYVPGTGQTAHGWGEGWV